MARGGVALAREARGCADGEGAGREGWEGVDGGESDADGWEWAIQRASSGKVEAGILRQEAFGISVDEVVDGVRGIAASAHLEGGVGDGEGAADAPVAGAVHPDVHEVCALNDVNRTGGGAFGFWVEGEAGPEPGIEHTAEGVFFDVVDDDTLWVHSRMRFEDVDDEVGAFEFVLEVWGMHEDELVVFNGELDVFFQDEEFVLRVLVETDLADAEHVWLFEELGDDG